ncbi:MAG: hypothetical protein ACT4NP_01825 [Pseudonocardiales bacterium]
MSQRSSDLVAPETAGGAQGHHHLRGQRQLGMAAQQHERELVIAGHGYR